MQNFVLFSKKKSSYTNIYFTIFLWWLTTYFLKKTYGYYVPFNLVLPLIRADGPFFENLTNLFSLIISTATALTIFFFFF